MKDVAIVGTFEGCEYKTTSYYGNPSYWVWFRDAQGGFYSAYTGSNCACGYGVRNLKDGDKVFIKYHFTKAGNCIVTDLRAAK